MVEDRLKWVRIVVVRGRSDIMAKIKAMPPSTTSSPRPRSADARERQEHDDG